MCGPSHIPNNQLVATSSKCGDECEKRKISLDGEEILLKVIGLDFELILKISGRHDQSEGPARRFHRLWPPHKALSILQGLGSNMCSLAKVTGVTRSRCMG